MPTKNQIKYAELIRDFLEELPIKSVKGDGRCPTADKFKSKGIEYVAKCDLCRDFVDLSECLDLDADCPCCQIGRKGAILATKEAIDNWNSGSHKWQRTKGQND